MGGGGGGGVQEVRQTHEDAKEVMVMRHRPPASGRAGGCSQALGELQVTCKASYGGGGGSFIFMVSYSLYSGPAAALTCPPAVSFGQWRGSSTDGD